MYLTQIHQETQEELGFSNASSVCKHKKFGIMEAFLVRSEDKAILKVRTKYKEKLRKIYHPNLVLEKSLLEDESSFLLQILLMIFNYVSLTSKATNFF